MSDYLGPHVLHYIAPNGEKGDITLTIHPEKDSVMEFPDGHSLIEVSGSLHIECDWFTKVLFKSALDEIQLLFRLLRVGDIYIQKICRDNGYQLYQYLPGDVQQAFDIY